MNFTIEMDHKERLILYKHNGLLKKNDIDEAWQEFLKLKEFTELRYNLLSDYSEARFDLVFEDVKLISDILFSMKGILKNKKQALILDDPHSTALSMLFEQKVMHEIGFIVRTFSTREAALEWLAK